MGEVNLRDFDASTGILQRAEDAVTSVQVSGLGSDLYGGMYVHMLVHYERYDCFLTLLVQVTQVPQGSSQALSLRVCMKCYHSWGTCLQAFCSIFL